MPDSLEVLFIGGTFDGTRRTMDVPLDHEIIMDVEPERDTGCCSHGDPVANRPFRRELYVLLGLTNFGHAVDCMVHVYVLRDMTPLGALTQLVTGYKSPENMHDTGRLFFGHRIMLEPQGDEWLDQETGKRLAEELGRRLRIAEDDA